MIPSSIPTETSDLEGILDQFRTAATAIISDNLGRLPGALGIRAFHRNVGTVVGRALTVKVPSGDNLFIHKAMDMDMVKPGDFIVVDGCGDTSRALIGEIMVEIAKSRGAVGFVIDGAIRDSGAIAAGTFPVFARGAIHLGPYKNGPGAINVPVSIGSLVISPGDIVVGDADGIVAFPVHVAGKLIIDVRAHEEKERLMLQQITEGTYKGAYSQA